MNLFQHSRKLIIALSLILMLVVTTACGAKTVEKPQSSLPTAVSQNGGYGQLERGNSSTGQDFGNWVVSASKGLIKDAYVRDRNKIGVVISPQVRPNEVKDLAKSVAQGFRKNFPDRDLTVLMYAPDRKLILTALYDTQSKQVEFKQAT